MTLTNIQCQNAKPKTNPYKISDGGGLYLLIHPNGSKYWRLKYSFLNKEKLLALGVYPGTTLAEARQGRDDAKKLLAAGIDPVGSRKQKKRRALIDASNTFKTVALEWYEKQLQHWSAGYAKKVKNYLDNDLFPNLGSRPIAEIDPPELLEALRKVEARGAYYNAGRIRGYSGQIFRYAVATGKAQRDPSVDLRGALTTAKTKHYAALRIQDMPCFLKKLERNDARLFAQTRRAIKLVMQTFTRTSELILATWEEIDFEKGQWEIPAERMKMRKPHIVPLSRQVIEIFKQQNEETKHLNTPWVFPNQVRPKKPMSNNTILFGIGRMGYQGLMTGHGFRALARTAIRENLGYDPDVIEAQLAHSKGDNVRRAYDRATFLPQRRVMMQDWSDYLDALALNGKVIVGTAA